jgi:hypothetical protein
MPILNLKGYGRNKPIEKPNPNPNPNPNHNRNPTPEVSSRVWDIGTGVPNVQTFDHIRQFLLANRRWSCRRPTDNYYFLSGYIAFQVPHTASWLHANFGNVGRGIYSLQYEEPNQFRDREMDLVEEFSGMGYEVIILIDDGQI